MQQFTASDVFVSGRDRPAVAEYQKLAALQDMDVELLTKLSRAQVRPEFAAQNIVDIYGGLCFHLRTHDTHLHPKAQELWRSLARSNPAYGIRDESDDDDQDTLSECCYDDTVPDYQSGDDADDDDEPLSPRAPAASSAAAPSEESPKSAAASSDSAESIQAHRAADQHAKPPSAGDTSAGESSSRRQHSTSSGAPPAASSTPVRSGSASALSPTANRFHLFGLDRRSSVKDLPLAKVVKAGYIEKKGGGNRRSNWTRRWFVLERGKLSYYVDSEKRALKGSIVLEAGSTVFEGRPMKSDSKATTTSRVGSQRESLLFCLTTPTRTLLLCGSSIDHAHEWVAAIKACIPDTLDSPSSSLSPAAASEHSDSSASVAASSSPASITTTGSAAGFQVGYMEKLGGAGRIVWQKRWFVLSPDGVLRWFKSSRSREPRNFGTIQVDGLVCDDVSMRISVPVEKWRRESPDAAVEQVTLRCVDEMSYRSWSSTLRSFSREQVKDEEAVPEAELAERLLDSEPELRKSVETGVDPSKLFRNREPIGKGSFGEVFKARYVENGEAVALKVLTYSERYCHILAEELRILDRCDHPAILGLLGCWLWKRHIYITTEYCEFGDLANVLPSIRHRENLLAAVTHQLLLGLDYLASHSIVHRDIKAENILVSSDLQVRIADLGLAVDLTRWPGGKARGSSGTPGFMAPEVLGKRLFDTKADVYSFGCLLLDMERRTSVQQDPLRRIYVNMFIGEQLPATADGSSAAGYPKLRELAKDCLRWNPDDRPTAADLLRHAFFNDMADMKMLQSAAKSLMAIGKEMSQIPMI